MAKERLTLETEVQEILSYIDNGDNFLLSGGAGSGKTYSLVGVIRQVISKNPVSKIACITYTNAAVKEIEERVNHKNLVVSTIHDFLWDNIKHFQKELKSSLVELMNNEESKIKNPEKNSVSVDYFNDTENGIQYKEYLRIKEGIISHDEVLILANYLFKSYSKLCDILKDKFQFIFIDEYQDTNANVVEILLTHLKQSEKKNIIGFFGDSMQSIYDDGIGDLNDYKDDIKEVQKKQSKDEENKKGSKRDDLIKHLFKIQHNIFLYNSKQFNEFIRKTEYKINTIANKIKLKDQIEKLTKVGDKTIEEIINKADEYGIFKVSSKSLIFFKLLNSSLLSIINWRFK